jgi:peptide deformylase
MAIRKIYTVDHPVLRRKAKKINRFDAYLERLVADMFETMRAAPGVGLAAPQIGESIRVLVAEYEDEHVALVNPEILKKSDEILLGTEGCLSIPGVVGEDVPRSAAVTVKARDPKGKEIRIKAEGWFARILQHEIDHLDGILFTDHIPPDKVRPVEPDEIVQEGEVEEVVTSGKNGKKATRPERSQRPASVGASAGRPAAPARPSAAARPALGSPSPRRERWAGGEASQTPAKTATANSTSKLSASSASSAVKSASGGGR